MFITANKCAKQKPGTAAFYTWHAIFLGIGLFVAAIRFYTLVAREDTSVGESVALAGLMFAITVLPALFVDIFIRHALAGRQTARDLALTKRRGSAPPYPPCTASGLECCGGGGLVVGSSGILTA